MKRIILRLTVFVLFTISENGYSYAETPKYNDRQSFSDPNVKHESLNKRDTYNEGHGSQQYKRPGNGNNRITDFQNQPFPQNIRNGDLNPTAGVNNKIPAQIQPDRNYAGGNPSFPSTNPLQSAVESEGKLATTFMAEIGKLLNGSNFITNPFGIWSITAMIFGVSGGGTRNELARILFENNSSILESAFSQAYDTIQKNTADVESITANFAARPASKKFKPEFANRLREVFKAKEVVVKSFKDPKAADAINSWAATATRHRITDIIKSAGLGEMTLVLGTAAFFKGRWRYPFNKTATFTDEFQNENGVNIGSIRMMRSREMYKNGYNNKLECQVIEIPYGDGETSMLVFLPRRKVTQLSVLERMRGKTLLDLVPPEMSEEEVDLSFPSFTTANDLILNQIYNNLDAATMLGGNADLPGLAEQSYISRISHSAEIETSEEGTVASAVTSAQVSYKVSSASFHANRPFIYFINHSPTRLVLFAGRFMTP